MPTYVYRCTACDSTFEAEQRITEDPLTDCACGATGTVKRVIQPIAVMFKGSGFHINDYAPGKDKPGANEESEASKPEAVGAATESGEAKSTPSATDGSSTPAAPAVTSAPAATSEPA